MKKVIGFMVLILVAVLVLPCGAGASLIAVGDPVTGGSWSQVWQLTGVGMVEIEAFILNDTGTENADFESPGMGNFSIGGWSGSVINPDYALATGPATPLTTFFNTFFTGTAADQNFQIDFLIYNEAGNLSIVGSFLFDGQSLEEVAWNPETEYDRTPVPEPATLLLLGAGLLGFGIVRRKVRS